MFKFHFVKDLSNGKEYYISKATLMNDEGPAENNLYAVDLEPMEAEGRGYSDIEIMVSGNDISVQKLDGKRGKDNTLYLYPAKLNGDMLTCGSWMDSPNAERMVLKDLTDHYDGTLEICGEGEESREAFKLLSGIIYDGLEAHQKDIEGFYGDLYAYGNYEKIFKDSPNTLAMINLIMGL